MTAHATNALSPQIQTRQELSQLDPKNEWIGWQHWKGWKAECPRWRGTAADTLKGWQTTTITPGATPIRIFFSLIGKHDLCCLQLGLAWLGLAWLGLAVLGWA